MKTRIIVLPEELSVIETRLTHIEKALQKEQRAIEDPIFNTEDLITLLKVSRRTCQGWRDQGLIDFSAINGKFYYRMSAINRMLNKHLKTSNTL